jgi:hypothetical protein
MATVTLHRTLFVVGTLGSAGREKMKTLHVVAERGRSPKSLKKFLSLPSN